MFDSKLRWFEELAEHAAHLLASVAPVVLAVDYYVDGHESGPPILTRSSRLSGPGTSGAQYAGPRFVAPGNAAVYRVMT